MLWFQGHAFVYAGYVSTRLLVYLFDFENVVSSNIIPVRGGKSDNSENHSLDFIWLTYAAAWVENPPTAAMSERLYSVFEFGGSEELFQDFFWLCCCKDRGTYWGLLLTLHFKFEGEVVPWLALGAGGACSLSAYAGFLRVLWLPQWG